MEYPNLYEELRLKLKYSLETGGVFMEIRKLATHFSSLLFSVNEFVLGRQS